MASYRDSLAFILHLWSVENEEVLWGGLWRRNTRKAYFISFRNESKLKMKHSKSKLRIAVTNINKENS
jgi:hypothetical protein